MRWTEEEIQFLTDNYTHKGRAYCSKKLNRTVNSVEIKAGRLKLTKPNVAWSKEEVQFLTDNYTERGPSYCAEKLNKTYVSVQHKASRLKLANSWSQEEEQFLVDNYADNGPSYCSKKLNRTYESVQQKAARLNLQANTKHDSNIVYVVYFPDFFLYKVGITNNVERRSQEFGHPCVILKTYECEPKEAAQLERNLLKSVTLINTGNLTSGNTETFTQPSKEIEEFIE